jgi:hypothetical protein
LIKDFIAKVAKSPEIASIPAQELSRLKRGNTAAEYFTTTMQMEFARAAFSDPAEAIFYFFGYYHLAENLLPELADIFKDYSEVISKVPQNSLSLYCRQKDENHNTEDVTEYLPIMKKFPEAAAFFMRVVELSDHYYSLGWVPEFGEATPDRTVTVFGDLQPSIDSPLPVIRRTRAPESMSEIIAFILLCAGQEDMITNPFRTAELQAICDRWKISGALSPFYDNLPVQFEKGISVEAIRSVFVEKFSDDEFTRAQPISYPAESLVV